MNSKNRTCHHQADLVLGGLAVVLPIFSVLGLLSIGLFYLPAAIASIMTAIIFGFRPGLPRPNDE